MSSYSKIFIALPSAHKLHSPLGNGVFTKEANQRAVGSPLPQASEYAAPIADEENSDLTSRRNFRCKWGATEKLQIPSIEDFPHGVRTAETESHHAPPFSRPTEPFAHKLPSPHKLHFHLLLNT